MSKPVIKSGPASKYAMPNETIVEFNSGLPNGPGGLISLLRRDNGELSVNIYRLDAGVHVLVGETAELRESQPTADPQ